MSKLTREVLLLSLLLIIVIIISIHFAIANSNRCDLCLKAEYDGFTTIRGQPFCYRVQDNGQIEYLRYEFASE